MKKALRTLPILLCILSGCQFPQGNANSAFKEEVLASGTEKVNEIRNATKENTKAYYEDTMKETVDTAITTAKNQADNIKKEAEKAVQEAKNQYNSGVELINQSIQDQADEVKNQVNKFKI